LLARTPPALILTPPEQWRNEHEMQIACTDMLATLLLPDVEWSAVDHGHSFDKRPIRNAKPGRNGKIATIGMLEAQKRKRRGVKSGLCDFYFWHQGDCFAIELKTPDGALSDDQREHIKGLIRNNVLVRVCWSKALVLQTVIEWHLTRPMVIAA
jgi:VRR-NUC domain